MFVHLDKTRVPTGYLRDFAQEHVSFDDFNGQLLTDSNYVTPATYAKLLMAANSASVNTSTSVNVGQVLQHLDGGTDFQIGTALFKYNYIKANALNDSLITYTEGKVYDVFSGGQWVNPYESAYLFGFTPKTEFGYGSTITFSFDENDFVGNVNNVTYSFDPGDGGGYRSITLGQDIIVNYVSYGEKELKLKSSFPNGFALDAHSRIRIDPIPVQPTSFSSCDSILIVRHNNLMAYVSIDYHSDGTNLRPFIIAEGFDPYEIDVENLSISIYANNHGNTRIDRIVDDDFTDISHYYDIFYIDWINYREDIRDNAELMKEVIRQINTLKHDSGSIEPNVVMGQSMGGLICQYALRSMEMAGEPHETSVYISHDVPYQGANLPLGACYLFNDIYNYIHSTNYVSTVLSWFSVDELDIIYDIYNCTSARQLMTNYVNSNFTIDNSYRISLMQELQTMGMPQGDLGKPMENLAVINGGYIDYSLYYRDGKILDVWADGNSSILFDLLGRAIIGALIPNPKIQFLTMLFKGLEAGHANFRIRPFNAYGTEVSYAKVEYCKWFIWLPFIVFRYNIINAKHYAPSSGLKYDGLPGSRFPNGGSTVLMDEAYSQNIALLDFQAGVFVSNFNFVPLGSSLNVSNYSRNYYSNPPEPEVETPFSSYMLASSCQDHISWDYNTSRWVCNQIKSSMIGPEVAYSGDIYSVSGNNDDSANYTWSSSNPSILSVNSSTGEVTAVSGFGEVTLDASSYVSGKLYRKTKKVFAGFPDIYLSTTFQSQNQATVTLHCVNNNYEGLLTQRIDTGRISVDWGFMNENDTDITWATDTTAVSCSFTLLTGENFVYCRLRDPENRVGTVCSVRLNGDDIYILSREIMVISSSPHGLPTIYAPLAIWLRDPLDDDHIPVSLSWDGVEMVSPSTLVPPIWQVPNDEDAYYFDIFNTEYFSNQVSMIYSLNFSDPIFAYRPLYVYNDMEELIYTIQYPVIYQPNSTPHLPKL